MQDWGDKKIETLSKGMSQKVQFIAAVVSKPELLILDEPFSGLDPVNAESLRDAVLEMRRRGTTVVFSTHDMTTAEKMCDRIFMIFKGRKVLDGIARGDPGAVRPRHRAAAHRGRRRGARRASPGIEAVNDYGQLQEVRLDLRPAGVPAAALPRRPPSTTSRSRGRRCTTSSSASRGRRRTEMKNKAAIVALSEFTR